MWDVRGWKRLVIHDAPQLVAAREEFLSWLEEVPEPYQTAWRRRLESDLDHPHYSARLELYLYHYYKSAGWGIEIEPEMPQSPNRPDFRVTRSADCVLVEAKTVLDEQTIAQQTQRLRQLADGLTNKLSREVIIEPLSDLPSSLPTKRIRAQVEQRAKTLADEAVEFDLSDVHLGAAYALKIVILPGSPPLTQPGGVGGMISGAYHVTAAKRIRDALEEKADKYGFITMPFLIALSVEMVFPGRTENELDALFGDRVWTVACSARRPYEVIESRRLNGFFTSVLEGKRRHQRVSAVLFYRFRWLEDRLTHSHLVHIYHNPFALIPLDPNLFPAVPQMLPDADENLNWINGEPE